MSTVEPSRTVNQNLVRKVYEAFFSPARYEVKASEQAVLDSGNNYRLPYNGGELAVTVWGSRGPAILLMHGWGGARAQMTGFVEPLLAAGYRLVAYDQPAHGASDGKMTNLLEIAPSMELIAQSGYQFDAIIAHSFGTLITSYALVNKMLPNPGRLAYLGAFNRLLDSLPRFQEQAKLPDAVIEGLRAMFHENFGQDLLESINNEDMVPHIDIPALMFHDRLDNVTPIEDSRAIARVWNGSRLIETEGLGHRGPLQSAAVHQELTRFLSQ